MNQAQVCIHQQNTNNIVLIEFQFRVYIKSESFEFAIVFIFVDCRLIRMIVVYLKNYMFNNTNQPQKK